MRKLIYGDCFPRLLQNMRQYPGRWAARLVFLLGPWLSFWMVEILNGNDVFNDLYAWQVLMNLIWYYLLFFLCRLILGRNQWASTAGVLLSFAFGLVNHYVLRFRGRILFPADVAGWHTAANVAGGFDYSMDLEMEQALILLTAFAVQIPIFSVISDGSFKSLILPSAAMAFPIICIAARVLRAAVLNELKSDYVTYARARGFSNAQIVYGEVLRNALPAAITLFAQYCAALFGTSALVESVFSIQGLGIYLMDSCESMDIYGISGSILVCGVLFVLFNTLADLLSSAICPAYRRKAV